MGSIEPRKMYVGSAKMLPLSLRPRRLTIMTPRMQARILARTQSKPTDGSTHWSTRKLANELGVSHMLVQRVWSRASIKPHRTKSYMASDDPNFEEKAADIITL